MTAQEESQRQMVARTLRLGSNPTGHGAAMAIPGYGIAEQVFVGGFANFLSIYNLVITARILLSWFPQAQGVAALQPVYAITDPYLNLFRGLIPPIFGLDLSPILAFFLLNVLTNVTAAVGAEVTPQMRQKLQKTYSPFAVVKP
jgi:YggT family protein